MFDILLVLPKFNEVGNIGRLIIIVLTGIKNIHRRFLVFMYTDFNHRPENIARLLEPIIKKQADLVIGSRYIPGGGMHVTEASRRQYWLSQWGNWLVNSWLLKLPVMYGLRQYGVSKSSLKRMAFYYLKTALQLRFS